MTDEEMSKRAVTSGAAATVGVRRTAIFEAVRADRNGPVTGLLLALADAGAAEARVSAIELLCSPAEFG
ncbi:hypothetical protein ACFZBU_33515 [Embleya sp. NPDC008237]|uniref:hypothetical protein n=1 Tax=Embleya sp. NPDC008237 TaxID=3363978 RepID=UPI0036E803F1